VLFFGDRTLKSSYPNSPTPVKQAGKLLPDFYEPEATPEVGELDELETFIGSKKIKPGYGQQ
jgi:hypothetical protein